jgi:Flp pilus assembly pilin Flp
MTLLPCSLRDLIMDESGATLVEYSMVLMLVAVFTLSAISLLGSRLSTFFTPVGNSVAGA